MLKERPTVPEVLPLVNAYYHFEGCGVGGSLHVVLDDNNLDDSTVRYCIEVASDPTFWVAMEHGGHDEAGELLGRLILLMSKTQRAKLADDNRGDGYPEDRIERQDFIARCRALLAKYEPQVSIHG